VKFLLLAGDFAELSRGQATFSQDC
jgi:hypothetical protein